MHLFARSRFQLLAAQALLGGALFCIAIPVENTVAQVSTVQVAAPQVRRVQPSQATTASYVCPKCGKVHVSRSAVAPSVTNRPVASAVTAAARPVAQVSHQVITGVGGGAQNVLAMLNGQRSRQGLRSLRYDPALQAVAERRARQMASSGLKSHPPGSFAPGRYEGVGWSSSFSPNGVSACYTSDPNMSTAGAAMVTGRDGVYFAVVYR